MRIGREPLSDDVRALWLAMRDHHGAVAAFGPVRGDEDSWARRSADYAAWLTEPGSFLLVARAADGRALGYAMVVLRGASPTWREPQQRAEVESLSVAPDARGGGVGKALLDAVDAELAGTGIDEVVLTAVAANAAARRFYAREGFEEAFVTLRRLRKP